MAVSPACCRTLTRTVRLALAAWLLGLAPAAAQAPTQAPGKVQDTNCGPNGPLTPHDCRLQKTEHSEGGWSRRESNSLLIASQNTLHLSDSAKGKTKRDTFKKQNDNYDVNLLQEVMKSANLKTVTPGTYLVQDTGLKGASSYKERYAIIYNSVLTAKNPGKYMVDYKGTGAKKFARTPSGTLIEDDEGALIWFIDFHAIFGKSVELRRAEAKLMASVYEWFDENTTWGSTNNTVIAGDWNLPATDKGFAALKKINTGSMQILPNVKSSLNRAGAASEAYDHFVTDGDQVDLQDCQLIDLPNGMSVKTFRQKVSDHRGIECKAVYDVP